MRMLRVRTYYIDHDGSPFGPARNSHVAWRTDINLTTARPSFLGQKANPCPQRPSVPRCDGNLRPEYIDSHTIVDFAEAFYDNTNWKPVRAGLGHLGPDSFTTSGATGTQGYMDNLGWGRRIGPEPSALYGGYQPEQ
ncbi:hypothetical protein AAE478_006710 [Parahypoxylon ruwenzoriense]